MRPGGDKICDKLHRPKKSSKKMANLKKIFISNE